MPLDYTPLERKPTSEQTQHYKAAYPKVRSNSSIFRILFLSILLAVILVPFSITLITTPNPALAIIFGVMLLFIAIVVGLAYAAHYYTLQRRVKLYLFALQNKLTFFADSSAADYTGLIFRIGDNRRITEAIRLPNGIEVGQYVYTTGNGKNRTEHRWVYASIKLTRMLPNMVLDAKSNNVFGISTMPVASRNQRLSLEGDFDQYFTLYAPEQYERDALYVFTPDLMQLLIDKGAKHDMEIVDDTIYIYDTATQEISNSKELQNILAIANLLGDKFRDSTKRYADERVAENQQGTMVAESGSRLKQNTGVYGVVGFVILLIIIFFFNSHMFM